LIFSKSKNNKEVEWSDDGISLKKKKKKRVVTECWTVL
jgi:hypothetical protein